MAPGSSAARGRRSPTCTSARAEDGRDSRGRTAPEDASQQLTSSKTHHKIWLEHFGHTFRGNITCRSVLLLQTMIYLLSSLCIFEWKVLGILNSYCCLAEWQRAAVHEMVMIRCRSRIVLVYLNIEHGHCNDRVSTDSCRNNKSMVIPGSPARRVLAFPGIFMEFQGVSIIWRS